MDKTEPLGITTGRLFTRCTTAAAFRREFFALNYSNPLKGDLMTDMSKVTDLMSNVMQATQAYNTKVMEFATANCSATVAYLTKLATVKSPSEFVEVTTRHVREQTDALTRQARELTEMTQKLLPKSGQASS
jgi:hypothetical protein